MWWNAVRDMSCWVIGNKGGTEEPLFYFMGRAVRDKPTGAYETIMKAHIAEGCPTMIRLSDQPQ